MVPRCCEVRGLCSDLSHIAIVPKVAWLLEQGRITTHFTCSGLHRVRAMWLSKTAPEIELYCLLGSVEVTALIVRHCPPYACRGFTVPVATCSHLLFVPANTLLVTKHLLRWVLLSPVGRFRDEVRHQQRMALMDKKCQDLFGGAIKGHYVVGDSARYLDSCAY